MILLFFIGASKVQVWAIPNKTLNVQAWLLNQYHVVQFWLPRATSRQVGIQSLQQEYMSFGQNKAIDLTTKKTQSIIYMDAQHCHDQADDLRRIHVVVQDNDLQLITPILYY